MGKQPSLNRLFISRVYTTTIRRCCGTARNQEGSRKRLPRLGWLVRRNSGFHLGGRRHSEETFHRVELVHAHKGTGLFVHVLVKRLCETFVDLCREEFGELVVFDSDE